MWFLANRFFSKIGVNHKIIKIGPLVRYFNRRYTLVVDPVGDQYCKEYLVVVDYGNDKYYEESAYQTFKRDV